MFALQLPAHAFAQQQQAKDISEEQKRALDLYFLEGNFDLAPGTCGGTANGQQATDNQNCSSSSGDCKPGYTLQKGTCVVSGGNTGGDSCIANLSGGSNAERIWNYYIGKGLSAAQTAGIMGNFFAESSLNPGEEERAGDSSSGYGLAQWTGGRRKNLINYANDSKYNGGRGVADLGLQLDFSWHELAGNGPYGGGDQNHALNQLKKESDPQDAATSFMNTYERPAAQYAHESLRRSQAQKYFNTYSSGTGKVGDDVNKCSKSTGS